MINEQLKDKLKYNEPLFKYTTFRAGGPAAIYAIADSIQDLKALFQFCRENNHRFFTIGRGANLLISDKGYDGLVIHLGRDFKLVKIDAFKNQIVAGAAVSLSRLLQEAYSSSFEGLAFAAGIPATVGGAIISNAGAFGSSVCDFVNRINTIGAQGCKEYKSPFNNLSYRKGPVENDEIITEAVFQLKKGDQDAIKAEMEANLMKRKQKQPLNLPSAGSVFKNPNNEQSAGMLIEGCGLKGHSIGSASISDVHANFIVNNGEARAADIYRLMKLAQQKVKEKYQIILEPEIKLIGDFDE